MDAIYLVRDGQQAGPFTRAQVDAMLASGEVSRDTMAWYDGLPNWAELSTIVGPASVPTSIPVAPLAPASVVSVAPDSLATELNAGGAAGAGLRHLGKCLNQLLLAFAISIAFNIATYSVNVGKAGLLLDLVVFVAALGVIGFAMYAASRLASALQYPVWGIVLLCIGLLVPCVSLLILAVLTAQASKILKAAGIKVGLMGAKFEN